MARSLSPVRDAPDTRALVFYDAACTFCRWSLRVVKLWDRGDALRPLPLQTPAADRILAPVAPDERSASWHLALADGRIYSGGDAAAPLLRMLPGGRPFAKLAEASPRLTNATYDLIARHRSGLSRIVRALGRGRRALGRG